MSNLFDPEDIQPIEWMTQLNYTNPFSDRHRLLVRQLLDQTRQPRPASFADIVERRNQQSTAYRGKARPLVYKYRERLSELKTCTPQDRKLYTDLVLFLLFFRYQEHFDQVIDAVMSGEVFRGTASAVLPGCKTHRLWLSQSALAVDVRIAARWDHVHCGGRPHREVPHR